MRRAKTARTIVLATAALASASPLEAAPAAPSAAAGVAGVSTAFYYGARIPRELAQHFDRLVVDVDNLTVWPKRCKAELFAYVSLGEVEAGRPWRSAVPAEAIIGRNAEWSSDVVDVRKRAWQAFVLDRVVPSVLKEGIRGIFFDTLDSFEGVVHAEDQWPSHWRAIAELIDAIRARHPGLKVLLNRGFGVLPLLKKPPDGFVAESLFWTADASGKHYRAVSKEETAELLRLLHGVRDAGVPVIVIDYVKPTELELRRSTARRIMNEGFEPYISVPDLDRVGIGRVEPIKRRVLMLFRSQPGAEDLAPPPGAALAAPILEWMGYAIDYVDVRRGLPRESVVDRYAGAVVMGGDDLGLPYGIWIQARIREGLRVAFLDGFGFTPSTSFVAELGLGPAAPKADPPLVATPLSKDVGFETQVRPQRYDLPPYVVTGNGARSLLRLGDKAGHFWDPIVLGPWGGAVFPPYLVTTNLDVERRWIVNPFTFLRDALAIGHIPAPDVTTEAGRRVLTIHLDGDGFPSLAEFGKHDFAGQVILDEFLRKYPIPHTVSVIQGEVASDGLYPALAPKLEPIAREIFQLPNVEGASHTFSHPFMWGDAEAHRQASTPVVLPIPGYSFDPQREILGSLAYVDSRLMPPGKRARVLLWSGDCSPSAQMIALTERAGVENVNGGGGTITNDQPLMTLVSPLGMNKGGTFQVFAPVQNENVYTNEWHGPFYGYQHVIETFERTETPRRMSPMSIYYHFFAGTKTASVAALRRVYEWALERQTTKLYLSEYAAHVRSFHEATLARRVGDGAWDLGDLGDVHTVRLDDDDQWPALDQSVGVAGVRPGPSGRYVHLVAADPAELLLTKRQPGGPYLLEANGTVLAWRRTGREVRMRIRGHEPLRFSIAGVSACDLKMASGVTRQQGSGQVVRFSLREDDTGEATLGCS